MRITEIELFQIETSRYYGYISGHLIVKDHMDDGSTGFGEASDSKAQDLGIIARQYKDRLVGREARNIMVTKELLPGHDFKSSVSDRHLVSAIDLGACTDFNMACIPPTNPGWA